MSEALSDVIRPGPSSGLDFVILEDFILGLKSAYGHIPHESVRKNEIYVTVMPVRNIRCVRRYKKEVVEVTEVTEKVAVAVKCGFCEKAAVARFRYLKTGTEREACPYHAGLLREHPKWEEVKA